MLKYPLLNAGVDPCAGVELNSDGEEPDELKTDEEANEGVLDGPNGCVVVAAKPEDGPKPGVVFDEVPNKDGVVGWPKGDEKFVLVAGVFWLKGFGVL